LGGIVAEERVQRRLAAILVSDGSADLYAKRRFDQISAQPQFIAIGITTGIEDRF
jgi:hypothetical protein